MKQKLRLFTFLLFFCSLIRLSSQTTLIGGSTGNGDFEAGMSSWSIANAASSNQWFIGPVSPSGGANSAYISGDAGVTNSYVVTTTSMNHIYQSVNFPAGQTAIILSFDWKAVGETSSTAGSSFDYIRVSLSTNVPTGGTAPSLSDQLPVVYTGQPGYTKAFVVIPSTNAGTTKNLIFTWRNDNSVGNPTPGPSIDNIKLVSAIPNPISGNKTIPGDYNYIGQAIADINAHGVAASGVTFDIMAGSVFNETPLALTATGTMTGPIIFQKTGMGNNPVITSTGTGNFGATSTTSVTAASDATIIISGGDYITFDGIDVQSANFTGTSSCIEMGYLIRNSTATNGAQNNTIKNCSITLNRTIGSANVGILQSISSTQGGITPTAAGGANSFNKYANVTVTNAYSGIGLIGNSSFPDMNCEVTGSTIGAEYSGTPTGDIGGGSSTCYGIQASSNSNVILSGNTIRNVASTTTTRGLYLNLGQGTSNIFNNTIYGIRSLSTTSTSGVNASEITLATSGTHTVNVYNNMIFDLSSSYTSSASSTRQLRGMLLGTGSSTSTYNISHNSIKIDGSGSPNISSVCLEWGGSAAFYNVRNNIFSNITGSQSGIAVHTAVRSTSASSIGAVGSVCNFNDYFIANTTNGFPGITGTTAQATIASWSSALTNNPGTDANSINTNPGFTPSGDLHIDLSSANAANVNNVGTPLASVILDIDGDTRDAMNPDLGADEFMLSGCFGSPVAGMISPAELNKCAGQSHTMIVTGTTSGQGITFQWQVSSTGFSSDFTDVTVGTGANTSEYNTGNLVPGIYYYRVLVTCTTSQQFNYSNVVEISVYDNPTVTVESSSAFICNPGPDPAILTASGAQTYTWTPIAALSPTTGATVNATPSSNTTYTVTGVDENGCSNTAQIAIEVRTKPSNLTVSVNPDTLCVSGNAQLMAMATLPVNGNNYSFTSGTNAELDPMDGAIIVVSSLTDDAPMNTSNGANTTAGLSIPIGFNVNINGTLYSHFSTSPDGWIHFKNTTVASISQFSNAVTSTTNTPKIYPLWDDAHTAMDGNVTFLVTGSAPNRIMKVQWFTVIPRTTTSSTAAANSTFQAWIYEADGKIEFRYGNINPVLTASAGITMSATLFSSITFSSNTESKTTANNTNAAPPAPGTIYTFTLPAIGYTWLPSTFMAPGDDTLSNPMLTNVNATTVYTLEAELNGCTLNSGPIAVFVDTLKSFYVDQDMDTYGAPGSDSLACIAPSGYVANDDDCDDIAPNINPGAQEICNYYDDDCDASIDEGVQFTFYADADNDQFGDINTDTLDCTVPLGYVSNSDDCDDLVMTINPYAAEACDEVDNDCDELIDEGCGCTNEAAHNYDAEATLDDGSCTTCSDGIKNGDEVNIDCGGSNPNCPTCPPPTAVCGNIVTVYTGGGSPVYNGPGASDVWNIPAEAFDAGSVVYGTLSNRQVKRKYTNVSFNWTTDGSCIDATPNGVYNNNDKGLVYRNCMPVAPADFGKIRNFDMTISDQFGTSTCEGRYIVINSAPPTGTAPVYTAEQNAAMYQALEDDSAFSVFPNPGVDQIFIKTDYEEGLDKSVIITDITGRQVLKISKLTSSLINVDTQTLGLGTYTITLNSAAGTKSIKWLKVQ